jgi:two-component system, cell cycle sensor histidine kinase and response regulator CckA
VLTDVILPGPSGVDLARELVKRWRDVRVLFMSGYAGDHVSMGKAVRADACFLAKPFTPDVLLRAVREALTSAAPSARSSSVIAAPIASAADTAPT